MSIPATSHSWEELLAPISSRRLAEILAWFEEGSRLAHPQSAIRATVTTPSFTSGELQLLTRLGQSGSRSPLALRDGKGRQLSFRPIGDLAAFLHQLDRNPDLRLSEPVPTRTLIERGELVVRARMREAIASCALDGIRIDAGTGLDLLRGTPSARPGEEEALVRCYDALCGLAEASRSPLSVDEVFLWHRQMLGADPEMSVSQLRLLEELCAFASPGNGEVFVHPFIRACAAHFMMLRERLFPGGGRVARALLCRMVLHHGYSGFEALALSAVMDGDSKAALLRWTNSSDSDLTAPLLVMADVTRRAADTLQSDAAAKARERTAAARVLDAASGLNVRQLALLTHATRHPGATYTIETHKRCHDVVYQTARTDLLDLARRGYLSLAKRGKAFTFHRVAIGGRPCDTARRSASTFGRAVVEVGRLRVLHAEGKAPPQVKAQPVPRQAPTADTAPGGRGHRSGR